MNLKNQGCTSSFRLQDYIKTENSDNYMPVLTRNKWRQWCPVSQLGLLMLEEMKLLGRLSMFNRNPGQ